MTRASPSLRMAVLVPLGFVGLLWAVKGVEWLLRLDLAPYGVHPGVMQGLPGLVFGPLIHGSWAHLIANTLPLLILGTGLFYGYPRSSRRLLLVLYFGSGLLVWLFARPVYHIGASGLTHGLMFFIFLSGILRRDRQSIALALIVFFLYGGMIWSIFPNQPQISYESHLFGALIGVVMAVLLRRRERPPPVKTYSWERPGEADDSIGDEWRADRGPRQDDEG